MRLSGSKCEILEWLHLLDPAVPRSEVTAQCLAVNFVIHAATMLTPNWSSSTEMSWIPCASKSAQLCDSQKMTSQKLYLRVLVVLPERPDVRPFLSGDVLLTRFRFDKRPTGPRVKQSSREGQRKPLYSRLDLVPPPAPSGSRYGRLG